MKRNAITRIILYSILALTLTGILISGLGMNGLNFIFTFGSGGTVVEGEVTFNASQIKNLEINWAAGSVEIRAADTDHITISEVRSENSKHKMVYNLSGDTLQLDYASGKISIGFGNRNLPNKDLVITVPKDWVCKELEIDGAALSIDIQDVTVGKFELDGASCDVNVVGTVEQVDIDGASTDISISSFHPISSVQIDGASCKLELILPKECGFLVQMDGLSCRFHSDLDYSKSGGTYAYGNRQCVVDIDGISCDVTIQENPVWPITGE